jgi:hypothetical protein
MKLYLRNDDFTGEERPHYRSPELTWPNLMGQEYVYALVYINHNLGSNVSHCYLSYKGDSDSEIRSPADYYQNTTWGPGGMRWYGYYIIDMFENSTTVHLSWLDAWYGGSAKFVVDIFAGEPFPD